MASIDPRTMKQSGFWLEKCEFLKVCACQSGFFLGRQQGIDLRNTLMPLLCFQLYKKVDLLAIFYCARRSGIRNSRTRQFLTVYLRLQLQRQHNFVEIVRKHKNNSATVYNLILRF